MDQRSGGPNFPQLLRPSSHPPESVNDSLVKSGLKLNHLRLIAAVADTGQVSTAAERMNISQPAASRLLSEVEAMLKAPLFERAARGMEPTRFGEAMARRARSILLEVREANREIAELKSGFGGSVSLGSVTGPAIGLAVPAIRKVRRLYPAIQVHCQVETSNVLARDLLAARYDFVIGRIPDDLNPKIFNAKMLGVERACLIVRAGHPLLTRAPVRVADLAEYDWVYQPRGSLLRRAVEQLFLRNDVPLPENVVSTSSVLLTMALISETDTIAPIAEDVARFIASRSARVGEIVVLETDFEIALDPVSLITAQGRDLPPSAKMLYDMILEENLSLTGDQLR
ncbi:LysR family transcriptional regulator [Rhizobium alvei]|uniref:LysR family transcriptional regulator n=1 Tax=Rhizobium alvei TaxID=1132659 RepID=A0ABT8YL00_9HYPH|nr:LysR family transcriptional regulator [Rhizobium alvei]MDO6964355.1 LysR family transcriptional regulator [Rhizobium alvei]